MNGRVVIVSDNSYIFGVPILHIDYLFIYLKNKFIYLKNKFIYFILFLAVLGLHCCVQAFLWLWRVEATLHCSVQAFHCGGFSCCGAQGLGARASVVVAHRLSSCGSQALECRLSSCGARA